MLTAAFSSRVVRVDGKQSAYHAAWDFACLRGKTKGGPQAALSLMRTAIQRGFVDASPRGLASFEFWFC